jgi:membrane associated rhomboid family serine protease
MRAPPPITKFLSFPVTGGLAILAIAVSVAWWTKQAPVAALEMSPAAWTGQPWRLWTCALPHGDVLHLVFNVYWLWVFGALIEESFGSLAMLGLCLVLQGGSAAAEWAVARGGVGLSGVGYGLFGFLWVLSRWNTRFADVIDRQTIQLFIGWFFFCIVLTVFDVYPVANVAHAMGAMLGVMIGFTVTGRSGKRLVWGGATVLLLAITTTCSTVLRPKVNFSAYGGLEEFQLGYDALNAGQYEAAAIHLRRATAYRRTDPADWFDLGIAEQRLGHQAAAADAYRRALAMTPDSQEYQAALRNVEQK